MTMRECWGGIVGLLAVCFLIESPALALWFHWYDGDPWSVAIFAGGFGVILGLVLLRIAIVLVRREESDTNG